MPLPSERPVPAKIVQQICCAIHLLFAVTPIKVAGDLPPYVLLLLSPRQTPWEEDGMKEISLATAIGLMLLGSAAAQAAVVLPNQPVAGKTQAEWGVVWNQQFLAIPASQSPLADTTGAF